MLRARCPRGRIAPSAQPGPFPHSHRISPKCAIGSGLAPPSPKWPLLLRAENVPRETSGNIHVLSAMVRPAALAGTCTAAIACPSAVRDVFGKRRGDSRRGRRPRRAAQGRRNRVLARRPAVALLPPSQQPEADRGGTRLLQRDRHRRLAGRSRPSRQQSQERLPTFGAIPEKEADMTGSALIDFVIALIVICGTGALFFLTIDRVAPDALLNKIAKIAIGIV